MLVDQGIRTAPRPLCYLCGSAGNVLYTALSDRLFAAPGKWQLSRCTNPGCRLVWLNPMPVEEDIAQAYTAYYTHNDVAVPQQALPARYIAARTSYLQHRYGYPSRGAARSLVTRLQALRPDWRAEFDFEVLYLPAVPDGKLLDVGCGWGEFLQRMETRGWTVEGVDFDEKAVENARSKGLTVHCGRLADLRFADASFDAVTMSHLIEHVHDPLALLKESYRILRPQGRLVVVTPNSLSYGHRLFRHNWRGLEPPRHLHIFNRAALTNLARKAGFRTVNVVSTIRDANGMLVASRSLHHNDRHTMGQPVTRIEHRWGRAMQLAEWLILRVNPNAGEELALVAER